MDDPRTYWVKVGKAAQKAGNRPFHESAPDLDDEETSLLYAFCATCRWWTGEICCVEPPSRWRRTEATDRCSQFAVDGLAWQHQYEREGEPGETPGL